MNYVNFQKSITNWLLGKFHSGLVLTTTQSMVNELKENNIGKFQYAISRGVNSNMFINPRHTHTLYKPKLVSVGRVSREKNLDVFCQLSDKYHLTVVGDGPYLSELKSKYPNVMFTGMLHGCDLVNCYRSSDVMVFTSLTDTFGLVMIESMYTGTPVAAFNVTGPIDVIDNGITGYMGEDLNKSIEHCLVLDRKTCSDFARDKWTWSNTWKIMKTLMVNNEKEI